MNKNDENRNGENVQKIEKPLGLMINELKQNIFDAINKSPLQIPVKELIIKDVLREVDIKNTEILVKEQIEYNNQLKGSDN